jgi:hypothetical protein
VAITVALGLQTAQPFACRNRAVQGGLPSSQLGNYNEKLLITHNAIAPLNHHRLS